MNNLNFNSIKFSDLPQAEALLEQVINQFVVRPTGSPNLTGISGFLFNVIDTEQIELNSDITDHYVEKNTAIQDHIALKPERFTLRGFIGELNDLFPRTSASLVKIAERVSNIAQLVPQFATQAKEFYESLGVATSSPMQTVNQAVTLYDLYTKAATSATRQQAAFNYFYSMWLSRQLCTVETPWNVFTDMAIESVRCVQDGETNIISDFSVTFKKIRKVNLVVIPSPITSFMDRTIAMVSPTGSGGTLSVDSYFSLAKNPLTLNTSSLFTKQSDFNLTVNPIEVRG